MIGTGRVPWMRGRRRSLKPGTGTFVMALLIPALGFYLIWPMLLVLSHSFNVAPEIFGPRDWGLDNWRSAPDDPRLFRAILNSFMIWGITATISFPVSITIAWALARVRMPFTYPLEYMFWVAYMVPWRRDCVDPASRSGGRVHQRRAPGPPRHRVPRRAVPRRARARAFQYLQRRGHHLDRPDGQWHRTESHAADPGLPQHGLGHGGGSAGRRRI